ncbi:LuxR C-terminal-related transcriptional regulator [Streptomyces sp. NPDC050617]|uniref:helix-turn-helix transcriptional regulator n=1 Tax=Streptomyces sp. NPDC050617 TaxID=3154628 RepID=UPI00341A0DFB
MYGHEPYSGGHESPVVWRNHFILLLDRVPLPIAVCQANGLVVLANRAMAAEWGTVPGRLPGRDLLELLRPRSPAQLDRVIEAIRRGSRSRYPLAVRWRSGAAGGAERAGELMVDPVGEPSPTGYPLLLAVLQTAPEPPQPAPPEVSEVEARVLALVASGATTAAVGKAVGLTVDGVNYHLTRLTRRWRVPNRTALVAKAYVLGVLRTDAWPPAPPGADAED